MSGTFFNFFHKLFAVGGAAGGHTAQDEKQWHMEGENKSPKGASIFVIAYSMSDNHKKDGDSFGKVDPRNSRLCV